jgi:beta-galactosidase
MMKCVSRLAAALLLSLALATALPASRQRLNFDADWRFLAQDPSAAFSNKDGQRIDRWRWKSAGATKPEDLSLAARGVDVSGPGWADAQAKEDVFQKKTGFAWFRAKLGEVPGPRRELHFEAVDDTAFVYVNGKFLLEHHGWNEPFDVDITEVWDTQGNNEVAVLVENSGGPGAIDETILHRATMETSPFAAPGFDDKGWRGLHLPHDFIVEGSFDEKADGSHGFLPKGLGWYRKTFDLPASDKGKSLWIDFDGVYRNSSVWLNGVLLGKHYSGYTSFRYDISKVANYGGKNILAVKADARSNEGWWYEGGGIYRHVWLNKADPLHVAPWGTQVLAQPQEDGTATVEVNSSLDNRAGLTANAVLELEVLDAQGVSQLRMTAAAKVNARGTGFLTQRGVVTKPRLWSLEAPTLYRLRSRVFRGGQILDETVISFGFRTVRFDADKGLLLNGKPVKIQGTCNHQDFAGIGVAMPDSVFEYRIQKLKEMGSNAYRCSHNPPATELLDACDRLGLLVMDENRRLGDSPEVMDQVESMVLRDRNHPSIILWSLCNEEGLQGSEAGAKMGSAMKALINRLDPTRPVSAAMNGGFGQGLSKVVDLQGFNYHDGDYAPYHKAHPKMPLYGSETSSAVGTRGIYERDDKAGYVSAYDSWAPPWATLAEKAWRALGEREYMAGGFVWTGFDYRGEPTPFGWPCVNSHFGIMDTCGFPKDSYYYYQSWWSDKTVLHVFPHWNWPGLEGKKINVWVHSNCDRVELFLNGKSLGTKDMTKLSHLEWDVKYQPGVLSATGYRNGQVVAQDKVETTGPAAQIKLEPWKMDLVADEEDLVPVAVSILDAQGRLVPLASDEVLFSVIGPGHIAGVGNGNPSSHEPDKAEKRKAFNGRCMVMVQAGALKGKVRLTATANGLQPASVILVSTLK